MDTKKAQTWASWALEHLKLFATLFTLCTTAYVTIGLVLHDPIKKLAMNYFDLESRNNGPCAQLPPVGHYAEDTPHSEWATISWTSLTRLRPDCGKAVLTANVINGGGLWHAAELSLEGSNLPEGTYDIKYKFKLPDSVEPGRSRIRVTASFPEATGGAPEFQTPWVPFEILP